jgi:hypothetical protein
MKRKASICGECSAVVSIRLAHVARLTLKRLARAPRL